MHKEKYLGGRGMKRKISIEKIKTDAENHFRRGDFYCSESIASSIRENFDLDMPKEMIAMASGFPIGIGKSKCVCGAVSGAVMMLGYFFGRKDPKDPKINKTFELANELQQSFKDNHKVLCCSYLTKGMDMNSGEHKEQCISFTGEMAKKLAEIIVRELDEVENIDD
jgi:C_GCAxxG_C_C family probable redox protein